MAKAITFELSEDQAKDFERLIDEFNETLKRLEENEPEREKRMTQLQAETRLLLSQAREDLAAIKQINSRQTKMIWEQG
jgi:molecular chaperone DnaK (HSP70)